ncbi:MAG TPA: single-stranded-DNA-specific exonuclease RecJ, partial [Sedimentisphaerales bacterium]|nr:single-stranded-DNA-specific exonuclease RecJ [Sedimentisphaerales bacterium]
RRLQARIQADSSFSESIAGMRPPTGTIRKEWLMLPQSGDAQRLAAAIRTSPLVARALLNRGLADADSAARFLNPKLTDLIEPEKMPGVGAAVERLSAAIRKKERITIYGDYDVDGITGVSILWHMLQLLGAQADYYIPHRIDEGYGLNIDAIRSLADAGTQVMVTVDCGVTGLEAARLAGELGIDLVITDHHQFGELPQAVAIVHPALDAGYPNQRSAGALVAFKLAWALANKYKTGAKLSPELREFLLNATMFAAIGTVADVMELTGENRVVASYGLRALGQCKLCGINALVRSAGLTGRDIDSYHIGFKLAPMLNAAGRMGHARLAVELLTSGNELRSMKIAEYLKGQNELRRQCEKKILKDAYELIHAAQLGHPDRKSIVLVSDGWHTGVIGIVASRIVDRFHKPTILINAANGYGKGSGRSVPGFDLLKAIGAGAEFLEDFGGHAMAAGVTIKTENVAAFAEAIEAYVQQHLKEDVDCGTVRIEAVCSVGDFDEAAVAELERLGPFGEGNPKPIFASMGVRLIGPPKRVGPRGEHLQAAIGDGSGAVRCIGFDMGHLDKRLQEHEFFNVAYEPQMNHFNGSSNVQFVLTDVQFE